MRLIRTAIINLVIFLTGSIVYSQQIDTVTIQGEEIVIVASKITGVRGDISLSHNIIGAEVLKKQDITPVFNIVENNIPGLTVTKKGVLGYGIASGSAGDVRIRGIGSSPNTNVLILIDGRPEFMGMMGHPLPDVYQANHIEKVEVIKGPASTLYGSNAMGGVINLITRNRKEEGISSSFRMKYGSFNTKEIVFENEGRKGSAFYNATLSGINTDGDRAWSSYKNQSISVKAGYEFNKIYTLTMSGNHTKFRLYDPGVITDPVIDHWYQVERNWFNLSFDNNSTKFTGSVKLHANTGYHSIYDGWRSNDITSGLLFYQHIKLENTVVTVGFDYKRFGGKGRNVVNNIDYGEHFIYEYAPYVNFQYFTKDWTFNAGYRIEKNKIFGKEDAPKIGIIRDVGKGSVTFNISKGYRSPTIRELYLFPAPTPTLKPERVWNKEISFKYPIGDNLKIETSVFQLTGSNYIKTIGKWPNLKLENSGNFKNNGIELSLKGSNINGLSFNFAYAWLGMDDNNTAYNPEHKLNLGINYSMGKLKTFTSLQKVWNYYAGDNKLNRLKDYLNMNINLSYPVLKSVSLNCIIKL